MNVLVTGTAGLSVFILFRNYWMQDTPFMESILSIIITMLP